MLTLQRDILPEGHLLPSSYENALLEIEQYLVRSVVYDACPNDCIIFRGDYKTLSQCPHCHSERYVFGTTTPARRFTYLPLKPRLIRLFGTCSIAHLLQSHAVITHDPEHMMCTNPKCGKKPIKMGGFLMEIQEAYLYLFALMV